MATTVTACFFFDFMIRWHVMAWYPHPAGGCASPRFTDKESETPTTAAHRRCVHRSLPPPTSAQASPLALPPGSWCRLSPASWRQKLLSESQSIGEGSRSLLSLGRSTPWTCSPGPVCPLTSRAVPPVPLAHSALQAKAGSLSRIKAQLVSTGRGQDDVPRGVTLLPSWASSQFPKNLEVFFSKLCARGSDVCRAGTRVWEYRAPGLPGNEGPVPEAGRMTRCCFCDVTPMTRRVWGTFLWHQEGALSRR